MERRSQRSDRVRTSMCEPLEPRVLMAYATTDYSYSPFSGHTWYYTGTENGSLASSVVTSTAWVAESGVNTTRYDTVLSSTPELSRTQSTFDTVTDAGVRRYRADATISGSTAIVRIAGGLLILPPTLTPGQVHPISAAYTSGSGGMVGSGQFSGSVTVGNLETIITPAGTFQALKVTQSVTDTGQIGSVSYTSTALLYGWLAEGIGPIRTDSTQHTAYSDGSSLDIATTLDLASFVNAIPTIGSLSASAPSMYLGGSLTLTAENVSDSDGIARNVVFYLDSNNNGSADQSELLGSDSDASDGFAWTLSKAQASSLPVGSVRFLAVASDNNGGRSAPRPRVVTVARLSADDFAARYAQAPKAQSGLVDGDWIADELQANVSNIATSDAYWGARNHWFQDSAGDVWALWNGGSVHNSQTHPGQHEWVLTNLTDAAGLSGTMHFAPGSLSGITTGWNAFNIQGIQAGKLTALWWSPAGSGGTYVDTDGQTKQGGHWGVRGNGWSLSSISDAATAIGGAITSPPAAFLAYSESQGNGRTEFDPRPTRTTTNTGMSVVVVDANHHIFAITFSVSQRAIAGALPAFNARWVLEPLSGIPSLADYGLTSQITSFELDYVAAATQ